MSSNEADSGSRNEGVRAEDKTSTTPPPTQPPPISATTPSGASNPNVSPGKRNKRKMAEPRRRVTDFSIRNICSESTSGSSFASEIEADGLHEKRSKVEEVGHFQSVAGGRIAKDVAPLDVLVSLSLLTQHQLPLHQPQLVHSNQSCPLRNTSNPAPNAPYSGEVIGQRQSRRKSAIPSGSQEKRCNKKDRAVSESIICTDDCVTNNNSTKYENKFSFNLENSKTSNLSASSLHARSVSGESVKTEKDSETVLGLYDSVNEDSSVETSNLHHKVSTSFAEKPNGFEKVKSNQQLENDHKCVTDIITSFSNNNNNNNSSSVLQRKNYKNMTKQRRIEANARERTRVHTISAAFESLRKAVPSYSHNQRLSKLAILRIACSYILALAKLAELEDHEGDDVTASMSSSSSSSSSPESLSFSQCVDLCTQTIQSEGKTKRRH